MNSWLPQSPYNRDRKRPCGHPGGLAHVTLRGLVHRPGAAAGVPVVCLSLRSAQQYFRLSDRVNSLQVVVCDNADEQAVAERLRPLLPAGLLIQTPAARGDAASATLHAAALGLDALSLIALAVAAFVMLNTFLLNLSERRRRLALLNVLGATRGQVRRLLLLEAALFGTVGSLLGLLGGLLLERALVALIARCWGMEPLTGTVSATTLLLGVLAGPGVSLAAALVALRQSGLLSAFEELRGEAAPALFRPRRGRGLLGLGLVGVAGTILATGNIPGVPTATHTSLIAPALVFGLVGCVLALPLWMRTALTGVSRLLRGRVAPECEFALYQLSRRLPRTDLTAGVFFVTVTTAVLFAHSLENTLTDLQIWYKRTIVADFLVRGAAPDSGLLLAAPLPERLASELAAVEGVASVDKISFLPGRAGGESVLILPRTFAATAVQPLDLREGGTTELWQLLQTGEAAIGTALAHRLGLHPGDWLTLESRAGPQRVRVAATVNEYAAGGMVVYLEWAAAHQLLEFEGVHVFLVSLCSNSPQQSSEPLQRFCRSKGLLLQANAALRDEVNHLLERIGILLWVLIALAFLIAAFGILNTLALNFQEQRRDLDVVRFLGMTRTRRRLLSPA
jgi:putative ABC transport system permease protein